MKCEETTTHEFDKKAFGKSRHVPLLLTICLIAAQFALVFVISGEDKWGKMNEIAFVLQLLTLCIGTYASWVNRLVAKRSTVVSSPGCVVYRKRRGGITALVDRLAAGYGGHPRLMYTVYVITQTDKVDYTEKGPIRVKGDISAVRVYADGQTEHDRLQVRRVVIPQYYTFAHVIRYTLTDMAGMPAEQQGFPERIEN